MCRWFPHSGYTGIYSDWGAIYQVVVPSNCRQHVLTLAHEHPHLGVSKTYQHILRHLFWPKLRTDVLNFSRSCQTCQVVGKPNQSVPLALLQPVPAIWEPFEHVFVDCVGTKSLLTFFTTFGLPRVVQANQGSNFLSRVFQQTLKTLGVSHSVSSAYHLQSQGALERWHQTLKSMLKKYCHDTERLG